MKTSSIKKSKNRLIAEQVHFNIFSLLRKSIGSDKAYAIASGYCSVYDDDARGL